MTVRDQIAQIAECGPMPARDEIPVRDGTE
jgi:hypothetical protein